MVETNPPKFYTGGDGFAHPVWPPKGSIQEMMNEPKRGPILPMERDYPIQWRFWLRCLGVAVFFGALYVWLP